MKEYTICFKYKGEGYCRNVTADTEDVAISIAYLRTKGMIGEFDEKLVKNLDVTSVARKKKSRYDAPEPIAMQVGIENPDEPGELVVAPVAGGTLNPTPVASNWTMQRWRDPVPTQAPVNIGYGVQFDPGNNEYLIAPYEVGQIMGMTYSNNTAAVMRIPVHEVQDRYQQETANRLNQQLGMAQVYQQSTLNNAMNFNQNVAAQGPAPGRFG